MAEPGPQSQGVPVPETTFSSSSNRTTSPTATGTSYPTCKAGTSNSTLKLVSF